MTVTRPVLYLGTHHPGWLGRVDVPLCVSHRQLRKRQGMPRASARWVLDSGGFSELTMYGRWETSAGDYVTAVRRYVGEVGRLDWAAPQDWVCQPEVRAGGRHGPITYAGTGLTVAEHQARTVASVVALRQLAPDLPWVPVLQGWHRAEYEHCVDLYADAGVDLAGEPVIGVGSIAGRQGDPEIADMLWSLADRGLRLHGFGVKTAGLARAAGALTSVDSMVWSYRGRRTRGCTPSHMHEGNCRRFALDWRAQVLDVIPRGSVHQGGLW